MTDNEFTPDELAMIQAYADEAERGYDVTRLKRRGGRLGLAGESGEYGPGHEPGSEGELSYSFDQGKRNAEQAGGD
ncbi:MAG: hypothetical protein LBI33_07760, partial [Propionibacteriaceae bacterium]|nr:hypothetical protein [Propionibacteriaceae bacterium]